MSQANPSLKPGDRIPNFVLPDQENTQRSFYHELLGQPILLLVGRSFQADGLKAALDTVLATRRDHGDVAIQVFAVTGDSVITNQMLDGVSAADCARFSDGEGRLLAALLAGGAGARIFLLDHNQRVLETCELGAEVPDLTPLFARLKALGATRAAPKTIARAAPVLLLPELFDAAFCQQLIDLWKADHEEGGFSTGQRNTYDATKKKTLEHVINDPALRHEVSLTLARRVGPELAKVFNYHATFRFDAHIVMCYQPERRDFFGLHRDDLRPQNKRRFALSLNLNDDFEGGELHFPEYAPDGYKMAAGTGCIFSCPLLHEARPVTQGQRFVLTSFFCDGDQQAGANQRPVQVS